MVKGLMVQPWSLGQPENIWHGMLRWSTHAPHHAFATGGLCWPRVGPGGESQSAEVRRFAYHACFPAGGYRDSRPTWPLGVRFHQPDWQPNVGHHWRQAGNGVSLSAPVNGHPKNQSCRFPWHFPFSDLGRGLIFEPIIFYINNNISRGIISASGKKNNNNKHSKYAELERTYTVVPIAVETLGSINSECLAFITELGRRLSNASGDTREARFLFQSLSVTVQLYNAVAFQGTSSGLLVAECNP